MCANVNMQPAAIETSKGKTHHWTRELELTNKVSSYFHQCFKSTADCLFAQAYASKHLVVKHSLKLTHMYVPINPPCSTPQHTHAHTIHIPCQDAAVRDAACAAAAARKASEAAATGSGLGSRGGGCEWVGVQAYV
jgi:hypothetical protein